MIGFGTILSEGPISGTPRHPSYPYTKRHELLCATMDLSTGERNSPSPRTQHRSRAISNKNRPKCVNPPKPMLSQQKSNKIHIFFFPVRQRQRRQPYLSCDIIDITACCMHAQAHTLNRSLWLVKIIEMIII